MEELDCLVRVFFTQTPEGKPKITGMVFLGPIDIMGDMPPEDESDIKN
jgi:hypothetical protein